MEPEVSILLITIETKNSAVSFVERGDAREIPELDEISDCVFVSG